MILIIGALKDEIYPIISKLKEKKEEIHYSIEITRGHFFNSNKEVIIALSHIGKTNATMTASLLIAHYKPEIVINVGSCGGLKYSEGDRLGHIIIGESLVYHDFDLRAFGHKLGQVPFFPEIYFSDKDWIERALEAGKNMEVKVFKGQILTGDRFVSNDDYLHHIKNEFPESRVVEMESTSIAQVCYRMKVPFLALRSISDFPTADDNDEEFKEHIQFASESLAHLIELLIIE